jgi:predicted transcriptional regulator
LDLYNDNQVEKFTRKIAERLEIGTSVARRTLQELTKELENYRFLLIDEYEKQHQPYFKELTGIEEKQAITFLKKPNLLQRTNELIGKSGVIGEENNRQTMYLIFTSRKTNNPLHCISLGSSGVGKTHLQSSISALMPEEDVIEVTNLSANALYYFAQKELSHKIIVIEDLDGAASVLYVIRELASKKTIKKRVAHKDKNGNTKTIELIVEGPVCIAGATTQEYIYEDNANRSFLLYIDESEEQDQRIMDYQRLISAGKVNEDEEYKAKELLKNVQRALKPIKVINPYAEYLQLPKSVFKPRRTNSHYLKFIEAITFYKQYQREQKVNEETGEVFIETTIEDIQEANELIIDVLLRKSDTITGATRNHLERLKTYLANNNQTTFTNAEIRRNLRIKETTLRRYNTQLLAENYIQRVKKSKTKSYCFEVVDVDEYSNLKAQINSALQNCILQIELATSPPSRHQQNVEAKEKKVS